MNHILGIMFALGVAGLALHHVDAIARRPRYRLNIIMPNRGERRVWVTTEQSTTSGLNYDDAACKNSWVLPQGYPQRGQRLRGISYLREPGKRMQ